MLRFYKQLKIAAINAFSWWLDYVYVGFWQVVGFARRHDPKMYIAAASRKPPIILLPGIYERWQFMKPIADVLFKNGYSVHVIEGLGYNRGSVEGMAEIVKTYAEQHHLRKCILVAHSKGGLIGKYLLAHHNQRHYFSGMVSINTPYLGSVYARFIPIREVSLFLPNSPVLLALAANNSVNKYIISIYGEFDPHIPDGSFLKGAKNIQLPVRGHFKVVQNSYVHKQVLAGVRELSTASKKRI